MPEIATQRRTRSLSIRVDIICSPDSRSHGKTSNLNCICPVKSSSRCAGTVFSIIFASAFLGLLRAIIDAAPNDALRTLKLSGMLETRGARLTQASAGELGHLDFLQVSSATTNRPAGADRGARRLSVTNSALKLISRTPPTGSPEENGTNPRATHPSVPDLSCAQAVLSRIFGRLYDTGGLGRISGMAPRRSRMPVGSVREGVDRPGRKGGVR